MATSVKDVFSSMDSICDNKTDSVSNGKEFSFHKQDIHCVMNSFCNNFMSSPNMWD